jgi:biotin operon repressor
MTQRERDRLVVLKKAQKKLITQRQAAEELELTERHVRRLLARLKEVGDQVVIHGLRGRESARKLSENARSKAMAVLSQEVYRGFGPTLASEYLAKKHKLTIGREALRQLMMGAGLWRGRRKKIEAVHEWRQRRSSRGEMVQWDTSEHDWLEGRGEKMYLIHMIDDATSELTARFVPHDSTEENMRLLWSYVEQHGRPLSFYTDKAAMFQTPFRTPRGSTALPREEREPLPPTQLGRGLRELGITWIAAHSAPAKGRVERSFSTAQDRLVKGLRVAGAKTLEQANAYLKEEFLPWWNQHLVVLPANPTDAHRPLGPEHDLAACLSLVETRQVGNDYTLRFRHELYQIAREQVRPGLRGANVRVEARLDGSIAVRFQQQYLTIAECPPPVKPAPVIPHPVKPQRRYPSEAARRSQQNLLQGKTPPLWQMARIDRTRTRQSLDS